MKYTTGPTISAVLFLLIIGACSPIPGSISLDFFFNPDSDLDALLDRYTGSHVDHGCHMELLIDGVASRKAFESLIRSAQDHINIETLYFDNDSEKPENISLAFVELLADKARSGVRVNVIVDPVVQRSVKGGEMVAILREAGVEVRYFMPPLEKLLFDQLLYRSHKKILIVDGVSGVTGGMNYGYYYLGPDQWRDTNVLLTGPVVATLQREFLRDWKALGGHFEDESRYFPPLAATGDLSIRIVEQRPAHHVFDVNEMIRIALRSARTHVDIQAPYFNPTDWLTEELIFAADRGVRIRILINSLESNDIPSSFFTSAAYFQSMIDRGVEIYLWNDGSRTMHSKAMVVDEQLAFIGSYNFNYRSIVWDTENVTVFTDPEPIAEIQWMIDGDFGRPFVFPVDQAWIDAHDPRERSSWNFTRNVFGWLF